MVSVTYKLSGFAVSRAGRAAFAALRLLAVSIVPCNSATARYVEDLRDIGDGGGLELLALLGAGLAGAAFGSVVKDPKVTHVVSFRVIPIGFGVYVYSRWGPDQLVRTSDFINGALLFAIACAAGLLLGALFDAGASSGRK